MKTQILKILRSSNDYISGQMICNLLGVSRTAVWKYMNQLKEDGYEIEAVQNKGYHITKYPDVITEIELGSLFENEFMGKEIYYYEELDSTNNEAKKKSEDGVPHGTLIITESQKGGRGRRGRKWISPKGNGIWMTFVLRPDIEPNCAPMLTLVTALAVVSALENIEGLKSMIKWPNDIVVNGKKVCGILTEMSADPDSVGYVVIGVGMNVNTREFDDDIQDVATSLFMETGLELKRSQIIADFSKSFEHYYNIFMQTKDITSLVSEYNRLLVNVGKEVKIMDARSEFKAMAIGINEKGELLVKKEDGCIEKIISGEVSVRGLYGYV